MYLRTGSAGPTDTASGPAKAQRSCGGRGRGCWVRMPEGLVGRRRLESQGATYLPLKSSQAKSAPITTAPAMIPNKTPRGITCDRVCCEGVGA